MRFSITKLTVAAGMALLLMTPHAAEAQGAKSKANQSKLFAHASIETAWEAAVTQHKPLLVMFTSKQCMYCDKMLEKTYGDPEVLRMLSAEVEAVVAQAEDYRPLIKKMGIRGYPTTLIISPEGDVLDLMQGYVEAKKFAKRVEPLLKSKLDPAATTAAMPTATTGR